MLKFKDGIKRRNLKKRLHKTPTEQVAPFELDTVTSEHDGESMDEFPFYIYDENEDENRDVPDNVIRFFESGEHWSNNVN